MTKEPFKQVTPSQRLDLLYEHFDRQNVAVNNLTEELRKHKSKIIDVSERLAAAEKANKQHELTLSMMDKKQATAYLATITERLAYLSRRLQVAITKESVLTELSRLYPELYPKIVRAFEEPDEWWRAGDGLSLADWARRVNALSPVNLLLDSVASLNSSLAEAG